MVPVTDDEAARYQEEIGEDSDSFVLHVKFRKDDTETNLQRLISRSIWMVRNSFS